MWSPKKYRRYFNMAKTEERFPGNQSVAELESYLKDMAKKIKNKLERGRVNNKAKAKAYVSMIEDVINLNYFKMDIDVYTLMSFLKEDSRRLDVEISKYEVQKKDARKAYEALCTEPEVSEAYMIPDEWRQQREAEQNKRNEARQDLYAITTVIEELKREGKQIHWLKGMICRPKGFFAKI